MSDPHVSAELRRIVCQFPLRGRRRWLEFEAPREVLWAEDLDAVRPALQRAEERVADGHWVAGMLSYDAGPAFDQAIVSHRHARVPLLVLGVFDAPTVIEQPETAEYHVGSWQTSQRQRDYERAIDTVREHIRAGDTYQVNYSLRQRASFEGDDYGFFADLARAQNADHCAYVDLGDRAVCSASPELFFRKEGKRVISRPMKGTAARHPDPEWDRIAALALSESVKDRAENTMIVDMVRNDLGRIAVTGSVRVPDLLTVEQYPTIHTMTSTVEATTEASIDELFAALYPVASITGAPKVRTCEIIRELEPEPRGMYTGVIGAIAPDGVAEFNVAIRTAFIDRVAKTAEYGVGGGIVWDSDPTTEWHETRTKTRVLDHAESDFRLLETIAWDPRAGAVLLNRHLARLKDSASHFGFDLDLIRIRMAIADIEADDPTRIRLLAAPDGTFELELRPLASAPLGPWLVPVDTAAVQSDDEFLFHKTTRRQVYESASARFPDAPDVILQNEHGELTETTIGNLVLEVDGKLVTPPVVCGLLPGTFRAELVATGLVHEQVLTIDHLRQATKVWMVNSVRGWVPITPDLREDYEPAAALRMAQRSP